jgi:hypothetical protein
MQLSKVRLLLCHPIFVLIASLCGAVAYAAWVKYRFTGEALTSQFIYVVPIVVPFVAFLFDRLEEINLPVALIDAIVVITAIMRVIGDVPYVSGHALFLTYAILRPGSLVTRITAGLVMVEVIYLKYFVWHDLITPTTGIVLASLAAFLCRSLIARQLVRSQRLAQTV